MPLTIYMHDDCLLHNPGPDPSFAPARLLRVAQALRDLNHPSLVWAPPPPPVSRDCLVLVHTSDHIDAVLADVPVGGVRAFDFETDAVPGTARAALAAAGLGVQAVADIASGAVRHALCLPSPGGHHAEADCALGYCFFHHVGIAARLAQTRYGMPRVAVFDFDAHHGNGTQSLFWNYDDRLYVSIHEQSPLTGFADEKGAWDNIVNIPLPTGSGGDALRAAVDDMVVPRITAFAPDLLLISAGFDMHRNDPLSGLMMDRSDYRWLGRRMADLAASCAGGRLLIMLEGGYHLDDLADSCAAFVQGLMDHDTA